VKIQDGGKVMIGQIIIRQRGTRYLPGRNVKRGGDDTIFAMKNGIVKFSTTTKTKFDGSRRKATVVAVRPNSPQVVS
ncbi:MAG: 50S ribosomal protein L27, partial [Candidatus Liptonbacteria bacterium]|nr:50S ribosomal protein L27 [Candidatus Liptonbacteria bacterium]